MPLHDHAGAVMAPTLGPGESRAAMPQSQLGPNPTGFVAAPEEVARGLQVSDAELAEVAIRLALPLEPVIAPEHVPE